MNQKLTNTLLCLLTFLCLGCGSDEPKQTSTGLIQQINASGIITDEQVKSLRYAYTDHLELNGLTSITDAQAEILSKLGNGTSEYILSLNGLTSITDVQAEILSNEVHLLSLNGLTSITDAQAESLSNLWHLNLNGLTSITDKQAENLSNKTRSAELNGLTSITDAQAESLSKVRELYISEALQPLIDKYKKQ